LVFSYVEGNPVLSNVYGVSNNIAVEMIPYGWSKWIDGDDIIIESSVFDWEYDKDIQMFTGHTFPQYRFYYENGKFVPYRGEIVSSEYIESFINGREINNEIYSDDSVIQVQYIRRDDGYIQINIAKDDVYFIEFSHRTYSINDNTNELELIEEDGGCYNVNIDDNEEVSFPNKVVEEYYKH
jgi:hypothetical protein